MATMEERAALNRIDARFDRLEAKMDAMFRTMIVVMATGGIAIAGAIVTLALRI